MKMSCDGLPYQQRFTRKSGFGIALDLPRGSS